MRLLSFLTAVEQSLGLDEPSPQGGYWNNTRMINYHEGLARLALATRQGSHSSPLGTVLVQSFHLADGSTCLKTSLKWKDNVSEVVQVIYENQKTDWLAEARTVAAAWLNGMTTVETVSEETELVLARAS
jgi:hypothetical protein